jgi:hypothetical protein
MTSKGPSASEASKQLREDALAYLDKVRARGSLSARRQSPLASVAMLR